MKEWDVVCYEVRKMISLLLKGNPNVLSLLWIDDKHIIFENSLGKLLRSHKRIFVSKKVYHSFRQELSYPMCVHWAGEGALRSPFEPPAARSPSCRCYHCSAQRCRRAATPASGARYSALPTIDQPVTEGSLTKAALVEEVAHVAGLTKKRTEVIVETMFRSIAEAAAPRGEGRTPRLRQFPSPAPWAAQRPQPQDRRPGGRAVEARRLGL